MEISHSMGVFWRKRNSNGLSSNKNRRKPKRSYPTSYIGVGYKDKGNATDVSQDGCPGWKETLVEIREVIERNATLNTKKIPKYSVEQVNYKTIEIEEREGPKSTFRTFHFSVKRVIFQNQEIGFLWESENKSYLGITSGETRRFLGIEDLFLIAPEIRNVYPILLENGEYSFLTDDVKFEEKTSLWRTKHFGVVRH